MKNLAQQFLRLGKGDASAGYGPVKQLYELLAKGDALKLLQLSVELTRLQDDDALRMFDVVMNMVSIGYLDAGPAPHSPWRAYTLCTLFQRPSGLVLDKLANPDELEQLISEITDLPRASVHVFATRLPTSTAFSMVPTDVFPFCRELRLTMQNRPNRHALTSADRVHLARQLAPLLSEDSPNGWTLPGNAPVSDESLFVVMLRQDSIPTDVFSKKVSALASSFFQFEARYRLEDDPGRLLEVTHEAISVGPPWALFRSSLHIAQAKPLASMAVDLAAAHQVPVSEVQVSIARVDEDSGSGHSTRVALHHPDIGLMLGLAIPNLAEHDQFALLVQRIFKDSKLGPVNHATSAYLVSEVDGTGPAKVFLPRVGWKVPSTMLYNQPPVPL